MNYAIEKLEEVENILKENIDGYAHFEVEGHDFDAKLRDIQTAIMFLQANQGVIENIKAQTIKNLQK